MFNEKLIKFMSEILLKYPDAVLKIVTINKSIENFCIKSRIGCKYHSNPTQNQNIYLLTHWGRVTHICVVELGHHWFR